MVSTVKEFYSIIWLRSQSSSGDGRFGLTSDMTRRHMLNSFQIMLQCHWSALNPLSFLPVASSHCSRCAKHCLKLDSQLEYGGASTLCKFPTKAATEQTSFSRCVTRDSYKSLNPFVKSNWSILQVFFELPSWKPISPYNCSIKIL